MGPEVPDLDAGPVDHRPGPLQITFTIRHLMTTVRGTFPDFGGEVVIADDPLDSGAREIAIALEIQAVLGAQDAHVQTVQEYGLGPRGSVE